MKTLIIYFFSIVFPIALFAQGKTHPMPLTDAAFDTQSTHQVQAQIKGKVLHASPPDLERITIKYSIVNAGNPFQSSYTTKVAPDGTFSIVIPDKLMNQQIWFTFGEYAYICIYLNEELELTFDLDKLKKKFVYWNGEGVTFGGKDGKKNEVMNNYILFDKKHNESFSTKLQDLNKKDTAFLTNLDSLFAVQDRVNNLFYTTYGDIYQYLVESETAASYYEEKLKYLLENNIQVKQIEDLLTPVYAISNNSRTYIQFLNYYVRSSFKTTGQKYSHVNLANYCDSILPAAYADLIKLQLEDRDVKLQRDLYKQLAPTLHFKWSSEYVRSQIAMLDSKIEKIDSINQASTVKENVKENVASTLGKHILKTGSGALLYIDEHQSGADFLRDLKSTFPNKLVVIDFWATWCIPCIQAIPYSKELHKQAKEADLPIEFVYICTSSSSSEEKWKNKVLEIEQPGIHVFVNEKVTSEAMNLFNKGGFPSYIMLKPDGSYDSETITSMQGLSLDMLKAQL